MPNKEMPEFQLTRDVFPDKDTADPQSLTTEVLKDNAPGTGLAKGGKAYPQANRRTRLR